MGGSRSKGRSKSRNQDLQDDSSRPATEEAAASSAEQPQKQPTVQTPGNAFSAHRDDAATRLQRPAHAGMPPETAVVTRKEQDPDVKDNHAPLHQEGTTAAQTGQQTARSGSRKQRGAEPPRAGAPIWV